MSYQAITRRAFLGHASRGLGTMALASLLRAEAAAAPPHPLPLSQRERGDDGSRGVINPLHFAPKAKRVIWLYQSGGPTHLETFDYKPKLAELHGQPMPESFTKGQPIAQLQGAKLTCFAPQYPVQEVRPERAGDLRAVPAHRLGGRRDLHHPLDADRGHQPRPGPHVHEHRHDDLRPARRWARGCSTAWGARARTCRASSCCISTGRGGQIAADLQRGSGTAASCPAATRA